MSDTEKLNDQVAVRMSKKMRADLEAVGYPPDLLREAAAAIIRCHREHGVVPKDMRIVQQRVLPAEPDELPRFTLNEDPARAGATKVEDADQLGDDARERSLGAGKRQVRESQKSPRRRTPSAPSSSSKEAQR